MQAEPRLAVRHVSCSFICTMPRLPSPLPRFFILASLTVAAIHCGSTASAPLADAGRDSATPNGDAATPRGDSATPKSDSGHPTPRDAGADAAKPCAPSVPTSHRPSAAACSTTRPPSQPGDAAAPDGGTFGCMFDSQCTDGTNGRCMPEGQIIGCTYDECSTDTQCGANKLCVCGTSTGGEGRTANTCVPSSCVLDSDCGTGGYCSPTYDTSCGPRDGVVGYFCHKPADECTVDQCVNDTDCTGPTGGGEPTGAGYCAWNAPTSAWTCIYLVCSG